MTVIASACATLLHEGVGHGVTAWVRGAVPTELTSNHLSTVHPDHWVEAGGTLVNLAVGAIALWASYQTGDRANRRYFFWLLAALNLLPGAGYFMFSGILGVGDWQAVISGLPNQKALRLGMALFGVLFYFLLVRKLAAAVRPFVAERSMYNTVGRWPYLVAGVFSTIAGAFDPLGVRLLFTSTIPAAFGGSSGLLWADTQLPREPPQPELVVQRLPQWWAAAMILGLSYIGILGPGIRFGH
jgi:hypothetical protein